MTNKEEMRNSLWQEFQEEFAEAQNCEFRNEEVSHLWEEYLDYVEKLMQKMMACDGSLEEWKSLFYALKGLYLYRVSLLDKELEELIRNMESSESSIMPEAEKELYLKQIGTSHLKLEIERKFQCWENYRQAQLKIIVERTSKMADTLIAKLKERESENKDILDEEVEFPLDNETESKEEIRDEKRADFNWEYMCSRHAAVRLREILGDLPEYEEWLATFKVK